MSMICPLQNFRQLWFHQQQTCGISVQSTLDIGRKKIWHGFSLRRFQIYETYEIKFCMKISSFTVPKLQDTVKFELHWEPSQTKMYKGLGAPKENKLALWFHHQIIKKLTVRKRGQTWMTNDGWPAIVGLEPKTNERESEWVSEWVSEWERESEREREWERERESERERVSEWVRERGERDREWESEWVSERERVREWVRERERGEREEVNCGIHSITQQSSRVPQHNQHAPWLHNVRRDVLPFCLDPTHRSLSETNANTSSESGDQVKWRRGLGLPYKIFHMFSSCTTNTTPNSFILGKKHQQDKSSFCARKHITRILNDSNRDVKLKQLTS